MIAANSTGNADGGSIGIPLDLVFGQTEAMQALKERVLRVAATDIPALILGESGTGKEILAKVIHFHSPLRNGPFVKVNCPAIPETLIESELFGHEEGAFTGAYHSKPGLVESAQGGTLFLDEIGELPTSLQAKLLRLLQDGTFIPVGGQEEKHVDVRLVSATNRVLEREVERGTFRQDLYYRINVVSTELPPLRERSIDIPAIATYFLARYQKQYDIEVAPLSSNLMQLLIHHVWPGNIRELENLIKRYVVLGSEDVVARELLEIDDGAGNTGSQSLKELTRQAVRALERKIILEALHANNWNRKAAARVLQISYRALFYKLKDSGVPPKRVG